MSNELKENNVLTLVPMEGALALHKNTIVFHEESFNNNAPHHYFIADRNGEVDENGVPKFLATLSFQDGPINEVGINGVMGENLLAIVADRLKHFQQSEYATRENACALTHIEEALMWLNKRTSERELRNVEGTHNV